MKKQLKNYGDGILASDDFLASIARECIERELMQRQCKAPAHGQWDRWHISDRD